MTLLLRDPDAQTAETPPAVRSCPTCQSPLEPEQDWCLQCGEAQSGRRASLPGKRAAATVMALTTLIVGGAVAASYAALSDEPAPPASSQLAQAPSSATPAPSSLAPAPVAPPVSTPAPAASTTTPAPSDGSGALPDAGTTPVTPAPSSSSSSSSSNTDTSTASGTQTDTTDTGTETDTSDTKGTTRTSTTPADTPPAAIKLADGAEALYDPYTRNTATGEAAKATDGNPDTSLPITVAAGATTIGSGLVVDLGKARGVQELQLTTKTPGFKVELYATDSDELPPDVLDTRWAHLRDVSDVGTGDGGKQTIELGRGTTKYRHVLLWFTAPPKDGLTVRVSELKLLG